VKRFLLNKKWLHKNDEQWFQTFWFYISPLLKTKIVLLLLNWPENFSIQWNIRSGFLTFCSHVLGYETVFVCYLNKSVLNCIEISLYCLANLLSWSISIRKKNYCVFLVWDGSEMSCHKRVNKKFLQTSWEC